MSDVLDQSTRLASTGPLCSDFGLPPVPDSFLEPFFSAISFARSESLEEVPIASEINLALIEGISDFARARYAEEILDFHSSLYPSLFAFSHSELMYFMCALSAASCLSTSACTLLMIVSLMNSLKTLSGSTLPRSLIMFLTSRSIPTLTSPKKVLYL